MSSISKWSDTRLPVVIPAAIISTFRSGSITPIRPGQQLRLPNWIPGSYMIRDFARNLLDLRASDPAPKVNWRSNKSINPTGALPPVCEEVTLTYKVYAKDLSVRAAHLDHSHGYYNGSSVFLEVLGQGDQPCEVLIEKPEAAFCADWKLATSLRRKQAEVYDSVCTKRSTTTT